MSIWNGPENELRNKTLTNEGKSIFHLMTLGSKRKNLFLDQSDVLWESWKFAARFHKCQREHGNLRRHKSLIMSRKYLHALRSDLKIETVRVGLTRRREKGRRRNMPRKIVETTTGSDRFNACNKRMFIAFKLSPEALHLIDFYDVRHSDGLWEPDSCKAGDSTWKRAVRFVVWAYFLSDSRLAALIRSEEFPQSIAPLSQSLLVCCCLLPLIKTPSPTVIKPSTWR